MVDTVVIKSTPQEAPEDHDQKMVDLVDKANTPAPSEQPEGTQPAEERPEWLPEKFKSAADMAKAYAELETKLGGTPKAEAPAAETPPDVVDATIADAEKALAPKGLNLQDFNAEFAQNGALSGESYEKLEKAGYDKALVDQFIEGQKARASQFQDEIMVEVGGDARYSEMVTWAKANLNASQIDAYNLAVGSGNPDQAKLAALGLNAQYTKAVGSEPQRLLGGGKASSAEAFESTAQVTEAMRDPRYKTDPAYRSKVQAKLSASNVF